MTIRQRFLWAAIITAAACSAGCVERKISIGSDPEGAIVMLNDVEVGRTPVQVPFTWYGDYDLRLFCDKNIGTPEKPVIRHFYLHTHHEAKAPWFQWLGVDLATELSPFRFKDNQNWTFAIPEVIEPTDDELIARARELKGRMDKPVPLQKKKKPASASTQPAKQNP